VETSPTWLQVIRDLAVIILAIETLIFFGLGSFLMFQFILLWRAAHRRGIKLSAYADDILGNVKDTSQTAAETAKTVSTTVTYVSDRTVRPVIDVYSAVNGARRFVEALFSPNRNRSSGETNGRD
jgi:hypothetical protein